MYNLIYLNDVGYLSRKDSNLLYILKVPCIILLILCKWHS
jgi:hypothetical protein